MTCTGRTCVALGAALLSVTALVGESRGVGFDQAYDYRISWNSIPAATARVTVGYRHREQGPITEVEIFLQTNAFVDLFWSLRAETWAEVDTATLSPRAFRFDRRIRGRPELTEVVAGPNGVLVGRYARPNRYRLIEIRNPEIVDPITAVLRVRDGLPPIGGEVVHEIFTGETRYRITLRRHETETISVPAGRFDAIRVEPSVWRVDRKGPDERVRRVTFWVTEGPPHTLLRVRSDVFIGAVYCDLTGWSEIRRPEAALRELVPQN